jgi:hypothetical protein
MFVCCDCCKLSGRGLWVGLITRTEESYRLLCVIVCDLKNIKNEEAIAYVGPQIHGGGGVIRLHRFSQHFCQTSGRSSVVLF